MRREFCCEYCGLIWFGDENVIKVTICPECKTKNKIYACDTFGYAYASDRINKSLKERGKSIHYAEDHPFYNKKK